VRLREHGHNLKDGIVEKSKLAHQAYEEVHRIGRDEARILETESNSRYKKYKESAPIAYASLSNPISQPNLEMSPIYCDVHAVGNVAFVYNNC
jgi:hypothetical protein